MELLKIEEVIGLEEDLGRAVMPSMYIGMRPAMYGYPEDLEAEKKTEIQLALRAKLMAEDGDIPRMLGYLDAMLKKSGTGWFVGDKPGIADCQVYCRLRHLSKGILDGIPKDCFAKNENVNSFFQKFSDLPNVKAYYEKLAAAKAAAEA